jgi:uncharacterized protein
MANPPHEPTMEEILASIRKIISEDTAVPQTAPTAAAEQKSSEPEVLDLTHEMHESVAAASASDAPVTSSPELHSEPAASEPAGAPASEGASEETPTPHSAGGIFSEKTRQALSEVVAGLPSEAAAEPVTEAPVPAGSSVEAVFQRAVKDAFDPVLQKWLSDNAEAMLDRAKPMIRDWLDEHFPAILEDAVRNELARAGKSRPRR